MNKIFAIIALFFACGFLPAASASACPGSSMASTNYDPKQKSDIVFEGKVVAIKKVLISKELNNRIAVFRVTDTQKGKLGRKVKIYFADYPGACGPQYKKGQHYQVAASKFHGWYATDMYGSILSGWAY